MAKIWSACKLAGFCYAIQCKHKLYVVLSWQYIELLSNISVVVGEAQITHSPLSCPKMREYALRKPDTLRKYQLMDLTLHKVKNTNYGKDHTPNISTYMNIVYVHSPMI